MMDGLVIVIGLVLGSFLNIVIIRDRKSVV